MRPGLAAVLVAALPAASAAAAEAAAAESGAPAVEAASGSDEATEPAREGAIEEITVTAEKREALAQRTPLSLTAFSGVELEKLGISDVEDLSDFTPNLRVVTNLGTNNGATVNIRGVVEADPVLSIDPAVSLYVDGVLVSKSAGALFDIVDLERVEVLRGPQGTLYGRNTNGGAINFITRKPVADWGAKTRLTAGNRSLFGSVTTLNVPFVGGEGGNALLELGGLGTLSGRLTVATEDRDGFYGNNGSGSRDFDDRDRTAWRGRLYWELPGAVTLDYVADRSRMREEPTAFQLTDARGNSAFVPGYTSFEEKRRVPRISNDAPQKSDLDTSGHALTASIDLEDVPALGDLTLRSITAYREFHNDDQHELDGSPLDLTSFQLEIDHEQVTQELQLVGTALDGFIEYTLGGFYFQESGEAVGRQRFFFGATTLDGTVEVDNKAYAGYGQATVEPLDGLRLTGGIRYTYEERQAKHEVISPFTPIGPVAVVPNQRAGDDFGAWSPMVSLSYRLAPELPGAPDLLGFVRVSRGFKSGGFNGRATSSSAFQLPFDEEELTAYEIGLKSRWLEDRVQLNASLFYSDYEDRQSVVFRANPMTGAETVVQNAAEVEILGAELELMARPVPALLLRLGWGWLDPEYDEFEDFDPVTMQTIDVSDDRRFAHAPAHTVSAGAEIRLPALAFGVPSARVDLYWQDQTNFASKDFRLTRENDYALVNARLELADVPLPFTDGSLDVALFGRNIFDKKYREAGVDFGDVFGIAGNTYGDPASYGIELTWHFGAL